MVEGSGHPKAKHTAGCDHVTHGVRLNTPASTSACDLFRHTSWQERRRPMQLSICTTSVEALNSFGIAYGIDVGHTLSCKYALQESKLPLVGRHSASLLFLPFGVRPVRGTFTHENCRVYK